jgi:hypothetical protein
MDEEEEVRLFNWILTNTKIHAVVHLWRSRHLLNFDFYRVTRMKLHIALQPLVFVGQQVVSPAVVNDSDLTDRTDEGVFFLVVSAFLKSCATHVF